MACFSPNAGHGALIWHEIVRFPPVTPRAPKRGLPGDQGRLKLRPKAYPASISGNASTAPNSCRILDILQRQTADDVLC
jgi:hypothetical protein